MRRFVSLLLILASTQWVCGTVVFSGTGQDLSTDPQVQFPDPDRTFSIVGTSMFFDETPGADPPNIAVFIPLFPAGTFNVGSPSVVISFEAEFVRTKTDYDPFIGVLVGSDARTLAYIDNNGGEVVYLDETYNASLEQTSGVSQSTPLTGAGFPPVGDPFTVTGTITLDPLDTPITVGLGGSSGNTTGTVTDRSQAIGFFIRPADENEELFINSLTLTVVPEPAPIFAVGAGFALLLGSRRRRG